MWQNMLWFKSYLSNSKQYIEYKDDFNEQKSTNLLQLKCGMPQGSILGSLLFNIHKSSFPFYKYVSPIMFLDDTNLFYSHKEYKNFV